MDAFVLGHVLLFLACFGVATAFTYWSWSLGGGAAPRWFAVLTGVLALWSLVMVGQLLTPIEYHEPLYVLMRIVSLSTGFVWFVFACHFVGRGHWLTRPMWGLLIGSYGAVVTLAATNWLHGLLWPTFHVVSDGFSHLNPEETLLAESFLGVMYVFSVFGVVLLFWGLLTSRHRSRVQLLVVLGGASVAVVFMVFDVPENLLVPTFEYGPLVSLFFYGAIGVALFRYDLFVLAPIPRDEIVSAVDDGVIITNENDRLLDYNETALTVLPGIENAFGERLSTVAPTLYDADGSIEPEVTVYQDDERNIYETSVAPITRGETLAGQVVVLNDVTVRKENARELEQQSEQLEEFIDVISHDIRNPLNVVAGHVELVRETGNLDGLDSIDESIDRMETLVDELLAFSQHNRTFDEQRLVPLAEVAREAWGTSDTANATLTVDVPRDALVYAYRTQLRTLFENLYRNAVDHGPDDVQVRVDADSTSFSIADDGPGVDPDVRDQLFDRGFTTASDGTGLGLAIVEATTDAHGWSVHVENDDGARFVVSDVDVIRQIADEHAVTRADGGGSSESALSFER